MAKDEKRDGPVCLYSAEHPNGKVFQPDEVIPKGMVDSPDKVKKAKKD